METLLSERVISEMEHIKFSVESVLKTLKYKGKLFDNCELSIMLDNHIPFYALSLYQETTAMFEFGGANFDELMFRFSGFTMALE